MDKNIITYVKPISLFKKILGYSSLTLGVIALLIINPVIGIVLLFVGVNIASSEGTQIDFINKIYRTTWTVVGIHIGAWKPTPQFDYASVFRTTESQAVNVVSIPGQIVKEVILVNLFYGNKHLTFHQAYNKAEAIKVAEHFRLVFNVGILDATGDEKVWLYEEGLLNKQEH